MAGAHAGEDNCLSPAPATGDLIKVRRPIGVAGGASTINQAGMLGTVSYKTLL